jgi:hypothetical protein
MAHKPRHETPIERIYREVTGNKMPAIVKCILLPKRKTERQQKESPLGELTMVDDEWIKTLADGRRVKFTNQELQHEWVFITAQIEHNKVVYSIVLTDAKDSLINRCINNVSIMRERHTLCREVGRKKGVTPSNAG